MRCLAHGNMRFSPHPLNAPPSYTQWVCTAVSRRAPAVLLSASLHRTGASWNHHQKRAETERGCVRSTSRSGTARPRVLGSFGDFGHPHLLRLVLRTQPRSGGGSKMRPPDPGPRPARASRDEGVVLLAQHTAENVTRPLPKRRPRSSSDPSH